MRRLTPPRTNKIKSKFGKSASSIHPAKLRVLKLPHKLLCNLFYIVLVRFCITTVLIIDGRFQKKRGWPLAPKDAPASFHRRAIPRSTMRARPRAWPQARTTRSTIWLQRKQLRRTLGITEETSPEFELAKNRNGRIRRSTSLALSRLGRTCGIAGKANGNRIGSVQAGKKARWRRARAGFPKASCMPR